MTNDWEARSRKMPEMAGAPGICAHSLQCYPIFSYGVYPVLPNVWPETPAPYRPAVPNSSGTQPDMYH